MFELIGLIAQFVCALVTLGAALYVGYQYLWRERR